MHGIGWTTQDISLDDAQKTSPQLVEHFLSNANPSHEVFRGAGVPPAVLRRVKSGKTAGETPAPQRFIAI